MPTIGSRAQVYHGSAHHTTGGLKKVHLMKNKYGRLVSKKKHALGMSALKNMDPMARAAWEANKIPKNRTTRRSPARAPARRTSVARRAATKTRTTAVRRPRALSMY